jgi:TolB-like protein/pimeloyl-ACP methyl ester carboxylesterase/tetratricopeptide (TPR) repeat protein
MRQRFGRLVFDTGSRELTRDGVVVPLPPKAFRLLEVLLEARPSALSKTQIHDLVWPDVHVSEASLSRLVSELRSALGEAGREGRFVRTVHGHGYAFAADVAAERVPDPPSARQDRLPLRLAVLPFADLSPGHDQGYLCEGIADELISLLAAFPGLQVASRQSCFRYAAAAVDARRIGAELDARTVLEGTVRRAAERLHVTARVLDVASGYYLWSRSFERRPDEVFAIQDEIVRGVAHALGLPAGPDDEAPPRLPTRSLEGYEAYLRGRQQFRGMLRHRLEAARRSYRRAVELDPAFALAHAGLADSSAFLFADWGGDPAHLADAEEASRQAVALAPDRAETRTSRALALSLAGDWEAADREFELALRLSPHLYEACYLYGRSWVSRGHLGRAAQWFERAAAADPDSYDALNLLAMARLGRGEHEAAREALQLSLRAVQKQLDLEPDEVRPLALGAQALAGRGERARAGEWARRALRLAADDPGALWNIGGAFAMAGETSDALSCLEPAILHCRDLPWADHDSFLEGVRGEPRFQAALATAWARRGGRPRSAEASPPRTRTPLGALEPRIAYCTTRDGVRLAYAQVGEGPLLVRVLGWFTHVEMEWRWPALRYFWQGLAARHTVVRYDGRGIGLSDPWEEEFSEETCQLDLEAVLEAVGSRPAALLGISEGGWSSAAYAVRRPERISHLVLYGAYARGARLRAGYDTDLDRAMLTLVRKGWGSDTPAFRQLFTSQFFNEGVDRELLAHFNELQRVSADPETAARYLAFCHRRGDGADLFVRIRTPTLVVHRRDDRAVCFEEGRHLAALVPGARFLPLSGDAHYFPTDQPGTLELIEEISRFLAEPAPEGSPVT